MRPVLPVPLRILAIANHVEGATPLQAAAAIRDAAERDLSWLLAEFAAARRERTPSRWATPRACIHACRHVRQARSVHRALWAEFCAEQGLGVRRAA